jgi:PAS domain S-box-containing protein
MGSKVTNKQGLQGSASEQSFQRLVDGVTVYAIYMLTPQGMINTWNSGARRIKGYSADEIIGKHFSVFYTPEDRAKEEPARSLAVASETGTFNTEAWRVRKDGSKFWASVVIDTLRDDDGDLIGFAKITRDITERKLAQDALRETEQRFRILLQGATDYAICMLSPDGKISNWNAGAERIKGYSEAEVIGKHFSLFYTEEDIAAGEPGRALESAVRQGKYEKKGWRVRRDGSRFLGNVVIDALHDDQGNLVGFAKITRDVTERQHTNDLLQQTSDRLFQSQKMESLGKLTGGVAHDFNNILQIIGGNLELLEPIVRRDESGKRRLHTAINAVDHGAKLCSQLLAYGRRQPLKPAVTNLAGLLRSMDEMLRRALGEMIEVETVIAGGLWNTVVDPHPLENVILNIAINSRDAMKDGGKLTIELGNANLDDHYVATQPDLPAGQYVMLAISDTGTGMTPDIVQKAFDPFFTTKPEGEGTGLGLSMAYGFVKQSGGHVKIYSEAGHGTTIKIYLPRSYENEAELPSRLKGPVIGGTETILVVEDDLNVQATVVEMLAEFGYRVLKANEGQSALAILSSGVHIDLLFTDVVMPGPVRSTELARQAKQMLPDLCVLFTSGYTQNGIIHGGRLDPGVELLSKPYRRDDLARKVRQIFGERQTAIPASTTSVGTSQDRSAAPARSALAILVVEDNPVLRQLVCDLVVALDHSVKGVRSAEEAIDLLTDGSFDVLLTDIRLPGMSGIELAEKATRQMPDLKVVLTSGYGPPDNVERNFKSWWLPKPYNLEELQKVLAELR